MKTQSLLQIDRSTDIVIKDIFRKKPGKLLSKTYTKLLIAHIVTEYMCDVADL